MDARRIVEERGYAVVPGVLGDAAVSELIAALAHAGTPDPRRRGGVRNLLDVPAVARLAASAAVRALVDAVLGSRAIPVRGLLFDKTPAANWRVPWHQDVAIAVKRRADVPGYRAWSVKQGVLHVHPPAEILEQMLAVRIHLDDCGAGNGARRVVPGSHRLGPHAAPPVVCAVPRGGVQLMRPLLWHASSSSERPTHRRMIHLEYAACNLPAPLEWAASTTGAGRPHSAED